MQENRGGTKMAHLGRDHNPGAFTVWMAGAGVKPGHTHGETDPIGYSAIRDRVSTLDFQATLLHVLGFDHRRLSFPFQGLDQILPGVTKPSRVVKEVLA